MASLHVAPVGTAVGGSTTLNRYGPQSTRPLPRWYWYSVAQHRWRRFDNSGTGSSRNDALEKISEHTASGLQVNTRVSYSGGYIYIVEWDKANRRGQFKWKESVTTSVRFERKSQREAAEIQANNFVYDHSGVADPSDRMLADNAHVVPMFRHAPSRAGARQNPRLHVPLVPQCFAPVRPGRLPDAWRSPTR